jgi:hypothetical protein
MTGDVVYSSLLNYIRKDKRGLSLSIDEFNRLSVTVDKRILMAFCSRFEDDIEITSHMGFLKMFGYNVSLTSGAGTLPLDYFRIMGDPYYTDTSVTPNVVRYVDVITSKEFTYRERDYLTKASTKYPTCVIGSQDTNYNMQIRVYPNTITSIKLNYIRDTVSPYLDYYVNDTTLQVTYLTQGQSLTIPVGSTYRDGTTGLKSSLTKDWEWDDHELPWVLAYFLQAVGVVIPDDLLLQVGRMDSAEIQNKPLW